MEKNDSNKQSRGGGMFTKKTYSLGIDGMKEFIFDYSRYKGAAKFNKTQKELLNYNLQSSEKGGPNVVKVVRDLKTKDMTPTAPTKDKD